jgi:ubiquinone/menaquinone biosynthesis C-methylase UbiE
MSQPMNVVSSWTHQLENGQQPSSSDLQDHLTAVHDKNAGFTEAVAWNCRDVNGKNSYELLADIVDSKHHSKVLELACGSGVLLDLCNQRFDSGMELSGIDISGAELKLARKRLSRTDIKLHQSAAQDLDFIPESSIDVILCHWALTLMDPVVPVLNTVKRLLKKSGVFAAIIDGDAVSAPGYPEINNIIYRYAQSMYPDYGVIELGDPRVRTAEGLKKLVAKIFIDFDVSIKPVVLSLNAAPKTLAKEAAGFFYASFVLSKTEHRQMLDDLETHFAARMLNGASCFYMPINLLIIRQP